MKLSEGSSARHEGGAQLTTKAGGNKNRPSAKKRGTPKSLRLENHTKTQCNV